MVKGKFKKIGKIKKLSMICEVRKARIFSDSVWFDKDLGREARNYAEKQAMLCNKSRLMCAKINQIIEEMRTV